MVEASLFLKVFFVGAAATGWEGGINEIEELLDSEDRGDPVPVVSGSFMKVSTGLLVRAEVMG